MFLLAKKTSVICHTEWGVISDTVFSVVNIFTVFHYKVKNLACPNIHFTGITNLSQIHINPNSHTINLLIPFK